MKFQNVGAGWKKTSHTNVHYLSLTLNPDKVLRICREDYGRFCLFKNNYKLNPNQPDYILYAPLQEEMQTKKEDYQGKPIQTSLVSVIEEKQQADKPYRNGLGELLPWEEEEYQKIVSQKQYKNASSPITRGLTYAKPRSH